MNLLTADWADIIKTKWQQTPSLYKKTFIVLFLALNFVFLYYTVHFMTGNHSWNPLIKSQPIGAYIANGRFTSLITKQILGGATLPVLTSLLAFSGMSLSTVLLFIYWKLPKKLYLYTTIGLVFVLQPYILDWLFYIDSLVDMLWLSVYVIAAHLLSEKAYAMKKTIHIMALLVLSISFLFIALGNYAVVLNTIAVVFLGRILIDSLAWDGSCTDAKRILLQHKYTMISILISCVLYKLVLTYYTYEGSVRLSYMTEAVSISQLPARFFLVAEASIRQLWHYDFPFIPSIIVRIFTTLMIFLITVVIAKICTQTSFNTRAKCVKVLIFLCLLFATIIFAKSSSLLAESTTIIAAPRVDFFGVGILHALILTLLVMQKQRLLHIIGAICCVVLLYTFTIQNVYAQKVWKFGYDTEKAMWNRVLARVEDTPGFIIGKKYKLLAVGNFPAFREKYYTGKKSRTYTSYELAQYDPANALLYSPYDPSWASFLAVEFYSYPFISLRCNTINPNNIAREKCQELLEKLAPHILDSENWPHESSVQIFDDSLLVILNSDELNRVKAVLKAAK